MITNISFMLVSLWYMTPIVLGAIGYLFSISWCVYVGGVLAIVRIFYPETSRFFYLELGAAFILPLFFPIFSSENYFYNVSIILIIVASLEYLGSVLFFSMLSLVGMIAGKSKKNQQINPPKAYDINNIKDKDVVNKAIVHDCIETPQPIKMEYEASYCKDCGMKIDGKFCANCGKKRE